VDGAATETILRDGSTVTIRPIEPDDGPRIREIWDAMSAESRRRRFLTPANEVSEEELRYLVDVDHKRHEALLALDDAGRAVGVARFVRTPGDRTSAEVAVVVADDWHRRGLGTELLDLLTARARALEIERYTAIVSRDNEVVLNALDRAGAERVGFTDEGEVEFSIALPAEGIAGGPAATLRAAAEAPLEFLSAVGRRLALWRRLG
jgi:RimJ/RimL family protein N-acetyltransferase